MNATPPTANGWPFLVARGRRRGYRTLMAPGFLVADGEYGLLDEAVSPGVEPSRPQVIRLATRASRRRLTVAYTTHRVTAADVNAPPEADPRDEHSRPLTLLYGFVCADGQIAEPAAEDLRHALDAALEAYRAFLADEDGSAVVPSRSFGLRSRVITAPASKQAPAPKRVSASSPVPAPVSSPASAAAVQPRRSPWNLAAVALAIALVVVLAIMWLGRSGGSDRPAVGDCMSGTSAADLEVVDCASDSAAYKVLGKVDGKAEPASQEGADRICAPFPATKSAVWVGKPRAEGYVLCLAPAAPGFSRGR